MDREAPSSAGQGIALGVNLVCMGGDMVMASDHLALTDDEETKYAKATDKFLKSLRGKRAKNLIRKLEDKAPALAFAMTSFLIFGPRVAMTAQLVRERRAAAKLRATTPEVARAVVQNDASDSVRAASVEREGLGRTGAHSYPFSAAPPE